MEIKRENLPNSRVKLTITVDTKTAELYFDQAYELLSAGVSVPGFRPGKAPRALIESQIGQDRIFSEALEKILPDTLKQAIIKENLLPLDQPQVRVTKYIAKADLEYTAEFDTIPKIELKDYKTLKIAKIKPKKIGKKEIDHVLTGLQRSNAEYRDLDREAKKGDKVEVTFSGEREVEVPEGGERKKTWISDERLGSQHHPFILGEGRFVPGFEDQIIGMKKGEEKTFELNFPKDYNHTDLAGAKVRFKVTLDDLKEVILPKLDDELAKKISKFKTMKEMQADVVQSLEKRAEEEMQRQQETKVIEEMAKQYEIDLPGSLINEEMNRMMTDLTSRIEQAGMPFEQYLAGIKKTKEELQAELRDKAKESVKISLLISEIKRAEQIKIEKSAIDTEFANLKKYNPDLKIEDEDQHRRYIESVLGNKETVKRLVDWNSR